MNQPQLPSTNRSGRQVTTLAPPRASMLRARSVPELIDAGFAAMRSWPGLLLGTGLVFLLPVTVTVALIGEGGPTPGLINRGSWPAGVVSVMGFSLGSAAMGLPLARAAAMVASGQTPQWRACYRLPARVWAALVVTWMGMTVLRLVGLGFTGVGVVAVSALGLALSPVLALEGGGAAQAFGRALRLGGRSFGRALSVVLLQAGVATVLTVAIGTVPLLLLLGLPPERWQLPLAQLLQLAVGLLVAPSAAWTAACFYLDERARRDGLDLIAALNEWDPPAGAAGPSLDATDASPVPVHHG